jgi:hypothetical protein
VASGYNTAQSLIFGLTQTASGANGSFAGIAAGSLVTMTSPLGINPAAILPPGYPLWSVGGFEFTLASLTEALDSANVLILQGTGTMTDGTLADATLGTWVATFTSAEADSGLTFSWNSSTAASAPTITAPDSGASLLFMGFSLTGLAVFAKFRKQDKAPIL